jgi:hypothetical protein
VDLGLDVSSEETKVHPLLHGLGHPLKGEHHAVPRERDEPVLDVAVHGESRGALPAGGFR